MKALIAHSKQTGLLQDHANVGVSVVEDVATWQAFFTDEHATIREQFAAHPKHIHAFVLGLMSRDKPGERHWICVVMAKSGSTVQYVIANSGANQNKLYNDKILTLVSTLAGDAIAAQLKQAEIEYIQHVQGILGSFDKATEKARGAKEYIGKLIGFYTTELGGKIGEFTNLMNLLYGD